jgi:hypothetical protein
VLSWWDNSCLSTEAAYSWVVVILFSIFSIELVDKYTLVIQNSKQRGKLFFAAISNIIFRLHISGFVFEGRGDESEVYDL